MQSNTPESPPWYAYGYRRCIIPCVHGSWGVCVPQVSSFLPRPRKRGYWDPAGRGGGGHCPIMTRRLLLLRPAVL